MRQLIKSIIHAWPWPLTINEKYDRQTKAILRKMLKSDSVCVDAGCYKGEILSLMIRHAPLAKHYAFEPIPIQYHYLIENFGEKAFIFPYALGNEHKETTFHYVKTNPTYSGLQQRQYKGVEDVELITVQVRKMDDVVPSDVPVRLIKIDVEGGEYDLLQGARNTLTLWKPVLIFEHGIGAADKYGVKPGDLYQYLSGTLGYKICLMGDYLKNESTPGFTKEAFEEQFWKALNCYFIAT